MGEDNIDKDSVVDGYLFCQTKKARWLRLDNIYQKFHRSNLYDIGGTYIEDVADYWFTFKTENVGTIFLLHLFVSNRHGGDFTLSVSSSNQLDVEKKNSIVKLQTTAIDFQFEKANEMAQNYIKTYSFTEYDIELLKDKKLYISVSFASSIEHSLKKDSINDIKANHDFSALLRDPICSDFVIESAEGEQFKVHKVLLVAHSDVFKAMLKEDTAESLNNYVKLIDVSSEDLKGILEFIYTGTISDLENANFFNLLMLADQYNLTGLRELSQYVLSQQIVTENAIEILMVADLYNSEKLKNDALKFIKKNLSCLETTAFKEIKNVNLLRELCEHLAPKP